jgi:hypothetical protein
VAIYPQKTLRRENKVKKLFVDVSCKGMCDCGSRNNEIPTCQEFDKNLN